MALQSRILLVEDNPSDISLFMKALGPDLAGYVTAVQTAKAGLDTLMADPENYGMAVLDIGLPDMSGYALADRIRSTHKDLPLMFLTGVAPRPEDYRLAFAFMPVDFLIKPALSEPLIAKIRFFMGVNDNQRKLRLANLSLEEAVAERTKELQQSNDELQQYAFAVSHDLREPLHKIRAFGDRLVVLFEDELGDKGKQYLGVMQSASSRMLHIIDDLLDFSRAGSAGSVSRTTEPVSLRETLDNTLTALSEQIKESGAEVTIEGEDHILEFEPSQAATLFQNLLSNSIKFRNGVQPVIRVDLEHDGDILRITVTDNGIGFDPIYTERIFRIFERLHTRFEYPGTGIGLALCKRIVENHGGVITAEGRPGDGATFTLEFPCKSEVRK